MTAGGDKMARGAGAVVHRATKRGTEVLLVHRPRYDDWSLPKGHLDNGETYEAAALREVEEETGYTGSLGAPIGSIGYHTRTQPKVVRYWLMTAEAGKFKPNKEADAIKWLSARDARRLATYTRDTNLLLRAERQLLDPKTAEVHLVRHANAGQRSEWQGEHHLRPLSKKGERQACTTKDRLLKQPVDTIHSSHFARCDQTVQPLATALDVAIEHEECLAEGSAPEDVVEFLRSLEATTAVLCSHGDVISGLLGHLAAEGVDLPARPKWKKASIWTLDLRKGRVTAGRYAPPPSTD